MSLQEIVEKKYNENDDSLWFKTTPLSKVVILSILSFGFYYLFLIYGYWKSLQQNFGHKAAPFWRTIFLCISNFWLFPILDKYFKHFNLKFINPYLLASIYFCVVFTNNRISFRYASAESTPLLIDEIGSFILDLILISIIVYIQNGINNVNKMHFPNAPKNEWKVVNIIWAVILGIFYLLYLAEIFLPE